MTISSIDRHPFGLETRREGGMVWHNFGVMFILIPDAA
jgi:hypothetical protein